MKRLFFAMIASCIVMLLQAQNEAPETQTDSVEVKLIQLPDSTAIGAPDGKLISKEIGAPGGKMASEDGRVELIFPAGALTANTTISIQPITNLLPNGSGKGYRFEPSGIQFKKPVEIIFHYSEEETRVCPPELKFMAIQSSNGKWEYMGYDDWDSTTKSLKGSILHFSAYVNGNLAELNYTEVTLKVGDSHPFLLKLVDAPESPKQTTEDDLPALPPVFHIRNNEVIWKVNEQTGGNKILGVIASGNEQIIRAVYTAPKVLVKNSITVQLKITPYVIEEIIRRIGKKGKISDFKRTKVGDPATFTCKVELYDEYKITAIASWPLLCHAEIVDTTSFVARFFATRVKIESIKNGPPTQTKPSICSQFTYNTAGCIGPVHVNGELEKNYICSDEYPPRINFEFTPVEVLLLKTRVKAGKIVKDLPNDNGPSWPGPISFVADGNSTVSGTSSGVLIHKLIIDPIR